MSYLIKSGMFVPKAAVTQTSSADLSATGVLGVTYIITRGCEVARLQVLVVVAPTVTAPVITFRKRPTVASSVGQSSLGTITIPVGTAIGTVVYKDISPVNMQPGDEIAPDVTTAATAGTGIPAFVLNERTDTAANQSHMLASA